uniref:NADH-ubiquinone oxidoreductase chain 2 n=1 Tax=Kaylathalia klovstadi TaxID=2778773 RepID=A0A7T6Y6Z6_9HEXA|nr:NADH dehydrogenase subunit 2 [Kaylathalia klovstadi]QQK54731.1 NADH dehydrogenase subunit 2 [Kaylathalia klovstadi]
MLMKSYQSLFMTTLMMGTIVAGSSSSWFTCWLGLEINLMSMIPLFIIKLNPQSTETAIKYFLTQALASLIIIFISLIDSSFVMNNFMMTSNNLIFLALLTKAGIPPFHFWFPQVMKSSEWVLCALLVSWQKVAPFVLASLVATPQATILAITASCAVGALGGLNQISMKAIVTYSSIAHSGWMLAVVFLSVGAWMIYFMGYCFITITLIYMVMKSSMVSIHEFNKMKWDLLPKYTFTSTVMSLGGLPPFLGFAVKLYAIQLLMPAFMLVSLILISSSLVSLFYYTRLIYSSLMMKSQSSFLFVLAKMKTPKNFLVVALGGNFLVPLMVYLI